MTTKANIIIIEDEKNICSFIEHILEPQGYRVISANTGKEGLQYITSEHPDVILLDLGLSHQAIWYRRASGTYPYRSAPFPAQPAYWKLQIPGRRSVGGF